jgi:hypothetical protein
MVGQRFQIGWQDRGQVQADRDGAVEIDPDRLDIEAEVDAMGRRLGRFPQGRDHAAHQVLHAHAGNVAGIVGDAIGHRHGADIILDEADLLAPLWRHVLPVQAEQAGDDLEIVLHPMMKFQQQRALFLGGLAQQGGTPGGIVGHEIERLAEAGELGRRGRDLGADRMMAAGMGGRDPA